MTSLPNGITPFVRVPYQCGYGLVQQALDSGAMGIIFPHIHNKGNRISCSRALRECLSNAKR